MCVCNVDDSIKVRIRDIYTKWEKMLLNCQEICMDEQRYIIAEAGAKNNKNFNTAKKLTYVSASVKAFALNFQTCIDETLYSMGC